MADLEGEAEISNRVRRQNRLVNDLQRHRLKVQATPEGRQAISTLLTDDRALVRLWAASHALFWDESAARFVLEELRDGSYGLSSVSARYTLLEFDAGRLDPNWEPKPGD